MTINARFVHQIKGTSIDVLATNVRSSQYFLAFQSTRETFTAKKTSGDPVKTIKTFFLFFFLFIVFLRKLFLLVQYTRPGHIDEHERSTRNHYSILTNLTRPGYRRCPSSPSFPHECRETIVCTRARVVCGYSYINTTDLYVN